MSSRWEWSHRVENADPHDILIYIEACREVFGDQGTALASFACQTFSTRNFRPPAGENDNTPHG